LNHKRTPQQTFRILVSNGLIANGNHTNGSNGTNHADAEMPDYTPAPESPKFRPYTRQQPIRSIRFTHFETKDDRLVKTDYETQKSFFEVKKHFGTIYDAVYFIAYEKFDDRIVFQQTFENRVEPKLDL
jgi:hypothetical protein